jgi:hypothetical protein
MAIGFRAVGTVATSTTSTISSVGVPAGLASTDISLMVVCVKGFAINITTPDGWTRITEVVNGSTNSGLDTGSVRVAAFKRIGTYTAPNVLLSGTPTVAQAAISAYTRGASESWAIQALTTGFDSSHGANYSATGSAVLATTTGNWLVGLTGLNTDAGTLSAFALTETSVTFAGVQTRLNSGTTTGDDGRLVILDNAASSGTGSAAPVTSFTNASSSSGATIFIRLRVNATTLSVATINPFDDTAAYEATLTGLDLYTSWELLRNSTLYGQEFVRGGALQDTESASAVIQDYEFHFSDVDSVTEDTLSWTLNLYLSGVLQESLTTSTRNPVEDRANASGFGATSVVTFLKDAFTPAVNVLGVIQAFDGFSKEGRVLSKHNVLGKKNPIVITDVSSGMSGEFTILVVGATGFSGGNGALFNKQIDDLFNSGSTYYFQSVFPHVVGIPDFFFQVENFSYERLTTRPKQNVARASDLIDPNPIGIWTIDFVEVDRPEALDVAVSSNIWGSQQILNVWGTWQEVLNNNVDWLDVLQQGD